MVLSASDAYLYSTNATDEIAANRLQRDVDQFERAVRSAGRVGIFAIQFYSNNIGNPSGDSLTATQSAFQSALLSAGYRVVPDGEQGYWAISWAVQGAEQIVSVYSIRTTLVPGAVADQTISSIHSFFSDLVPPVLSKVTLVNVGSGADTDETDFGGTTSVFYEYLAVVQQQDPTVDYANGLRTRLLATGLGYTSSPSNLMIYKVG